MCKPLTRESADGGRAMSFTVPAEWDLTRQEAWLVAALVEAAESVSSKELDRIIRASQSLRTRRSKLVDVVLCKARRKLRPFNVSIETVRAKGFRICAETKEILLAGAISIPEQGRAAA